MAKNGGTDDRCEGITPPVYQWRLTGQVTGWQMSSNKLAVLGEQPGWISRLDELHLLTPARIVGMVLVALFLTIFTRWLVGRVTRRVVSLPDTDRERTRVRQHALATVLRSTVVGLIWSIAVITIVSEIGVNIGAFVATATVIGGALAFGAQTLVRDAVAGFFVIAEDQYGVGDVVDVGHATGSVERITLRSVRLRDGEGRIWHVPHGGIARTANLSKSPRALLDLDVARTSHLDELETAAIRLCAALGSDESVRGALLEAPIIEGLVEVKDDRLIYRVSVETKPGEHERVRKRWRVLALQAFERGELTAPAAPTTVVNIGHHDS
jgi:moderate conductance mechanosensitive channel